MFSSGSNTAVQELSTSILVEASSQSGSTCGFHISSNGMLWFAIFNMEG